MLMMVHGVGFKEKGLRLRVQGVEVRLQGWSEPTGGARPEVGSEMGLTGDVLNPNPSSVQAASVFSARLLQVSERDLENALCLRT